MGGDDRGIASRSALDTVRANRYPMTQGGRSSVVERQLPKLNVVGSIPIARSNT